MNQQEKTFMLSLPNEKKDLVELLQKYYVVSFALKEHTRTDVEELFANTINRNYVTYGEGIDHSTNQLLQLFLPHQIIVAKKVHALLSLNNEFINQKLGAIFKKGFNRLLRNRGNAEDINLAELIAKAENDLEVTINVPALIYYEYRFTKTPQGAIRLMENLCALSEKKQVMVDIRYPFLPDILTRLIKQEVDTQERKNGANLTDEEKKQGIKRFNDTFGIKLKKEMTMDEIHGALEVQTLKKLKEEKKVRSPFISGFSNTQEMLYMVYKDPSYKDFKRLSALSYVLGKDELNLALQGKFTIEDYHYFYYMFLRNVKLERLEDTKEHFSMYLAEYLSVMMYHDVFDNIEQELEAHEQYRIQLEQERMNVEKDSEKIKEEKLSLEKERQEQKTQVELLNQKIAELQKENENLQRKLSLKENEVASYQPLKEEVVALRNEVFAQTQEEVPEEVVNHLSFPLPYRVAYFGGHPNTVNKLRSYVEEVKHVPPESLSVDLSFAKNVDVCIFDTVYNNHSNYYRFKDANIDTPVIYITSGTGMATIIKKIQDLNLPK